MTHTGERRKLIFTPRYSIHTIYIRIQSAHLCLRCGTKRFSRSSNLYRHMRVCKAVPVSSMSDLTPPSADGPTPLHSAAPCEATPVSQNHRVEDPVGPISSLQSDPSILPDPSWGPEPLRDWKPKSYPRSNGTSLPVSQIAYVQDATLYRSVISAAYGGKTSSNASQSSASSQSAFVAGPALQNPAYAAAFCEHGQGLAWDVAGWECAASNSASLSRSPPQVQSFSYAAPPQLVAKEGGDLWVNAGIQVPGIVAGPGHSWLGGSHLHGSTLEAPPMSYMPLSPDATFPFSENTHFNNM